TGQGEPPGRRLERLQARLAPRLAVAGVVDLVQDHQGLALLDAVAVQHRAHPDTRVGDGDAVVLLAERTGAVLRVQLDPYPRGGVGPLLLQVLGGRHHGDLLHDVVVQQPRRQGQRERRLAGPGGGDRQEVARLLLDVLVHRPLLPGPQLAGGAPGGAAGERGRQVVRGRGGGGSHGLRRGGWFGRLGYEGRPSHPTQGRPDGGTDRPESRRVGPTSQSAPAAAGVTPAGTAAGSSPTRRSGPPPPWAGTPRRRRPGGSPSPRWRRG